MTHKQEDLLRFLHKDFVIKGFWPSIRDIQEHFDFKSTNAVMGHLKALERKGAISRISGQARTYKLNYELLKECLERDTSEVVDIPVYGQIAAGYPDGIESGGAIGQIQVDQQSAKSRYGGKVFALKVRGDSMINAGILEGDSVIVEPAEPRNHDIVAALIDGETTLKRYIKEPNGTPYLKAENHLYPELHPITSLEVQGVAKAVVRNL